jgi:hypothetical protein
MKRINLRRTHKGCGGILKVWPGIGTRERVVTCDRCALHKTYRLLSARREPAIQPTPIDDEFESTLFTMLVADSLLHSKDSGYFIDDFSTLDEVEDIATIEPSGGSFGGGGASDSYDELPISNGPELDDDPMPDITS